VIDLSIITKHSHRSLAVGTVFWSCLGGVELSRGVQQLMISRWQYDWPVSFLMGSAFLTYGIFWAAMLARRAGKSIHENSQQTSDSRSKK